MCATYSICFNMRTARVRSNIRHFLHICVISLKFNLGYSSFTFFLGKKPEKRINCYLFLFSVRAQSFRSRSYYWRFFAATQPAHIFRGKNETTNQGRACSHSVRFIQATYKWNLKIWFWWMGLSDVGMNGLGNCYFGNERKRQSNCISHPENMRWMKKAVVDQLKLERTALFQRIASKKEMEEMSTEE